MFRPMPSIGGVGLDQSRNPSLFSTQQLVLSIFALTSKRTKTLGKHTFREQTVENVQQK